MAINTLEMAKIFQQSLDKQMSIEATSGWMESNAVNVKYNGGDTVRMPRISTTGLARYDRDMGFNQGAVTLAYDDYKLTQDRGRTFHLDSMDVDESNFIASAGTVMGEFQRLQVVPEVDAYRYSKIAALAKGASRTTDGFTPGADTILAQLDKEITNLQDTIGETEALVILMATPVRTILNNVKNIERHIDVMQFKADAGAKQINWIIMARRAPIAISKTDKVRIFAPDIGAINHYKIVHDINARYWAYVLVHLLDDGFIEGAEKIKTMGAPWPYVKLMNDLAITPKGIDYLTDNSLIEKIKKRGYGCFRDRVEGYLILRRIRNG